MSIKNLYSLLASPWLITPRVGNSLIPLLTNIIDKGESISNSKEELKLSLYSSPQSSVIINKNTVIDPDMDPNSVVAVLPIEGTIMKYSDWCQYGTQYYMKVMDQWKDNQAVAGVLLDINSGGGSVSGTPEFADYIKDYPKPVVAFTNGMMCSAAYYIAAGADLIIATNYIDVIGSTGTYYWTIDFTGKYEKQGARIIEVYASRSTNKNGAIRAALDKKNPTTIKILEEIVDPSNNRFLDFITENRKSITPEALTGKEYFKAEDALKNGLVDTIGTLEEAINAVFELSQEKNNNSNNKNMSGKTYPKIAAALGLTEINIKSGFLLGSKSVSFTEEQLDKLESNLSSDQSSEITQLKEAVKQSLTDCKLESTGTTYGDIKLLCEKVIEYGKKDGDTPTSINSEGDRVDEGSDADILNQDYKSLYN